MIATYRSVVPERIRTPTLSPGPTPAARSASATSSAASSELVVGQHLAPLSSAGSSGWSDAVRRSTSTRVRGAGRGRRAAGGRGPARAAPRCSWWRAGGF